MKSYGECLAELEHHGQKRCLRPLSGRNGCQVNYQGRQMLNLTSNDYLGLATDVASHQNFYDGLSATDFLDSFALGSASSRLLTGDSDEQHQLEGMVAAAYGGDAALLYNSGYHANIGILPALYGKGDLLLSDKLNHASLHDGLRLAAAEYKRFRHRDYQHLQSLLEQYRSRYQRVIIISESVFSMDGDVADLTALVALKKRFDCLLYLDEAHAVGLYGERGLGQAEEQGVLADIDLLVGTFGKACASVGAFVVCTEEIRGFLINSSRSLIFTTALPPVCVHWNRFVFSLLPDMGEQRCHLRQLSTWLRDELRQHGLQTDGATNIVPVLLGENRLALLAAERLQQQGFLIFPVRPPAVPEGTARFRLSLTAAMRQQDLLGLPAAIAQAIAACRH